MISIYCFFLKILHCSSRLPLTYVSNQLFLDLTNIYFNPVGNARLIVISTEFFYLEFLQKLQYCKIIIAN